MKVVDLHPEDLLDKDASGELTETERERLEAHLARCAACRFEREVKADFADELGDTEELSSQRLVALIENVSPSVHPAAIKPVEEDEGEAEQDESEHEVAVVPLSSRARRRRAVRIALLAAAALLVGSVAAAGAEARVWARIAAAWAEPAEVAPPDISPPAPRVSRAASTVMHQRTPPEPREETADETPAPSVIVPVSTVTPNVVGAPPESAAALFDEANEARRRGDYARAISLHRRLQSTHPLSREAHVSHGTVGRLLLDRGDAVGALMSFDAYQARGSGPLDEAVMVGRATAFEQLGRTNEARRAWGALLQTFPETPYAEHARARVQSPPANVH